MRDSFKFIEIASAFAHRPRLNTLIALLGLFFFAFDLFVPLGVAGGVPYVALVLLGTRYNNRRAIHTIALACSLLTILGFLLSPDGSIPWIALTNRLLALLVIWATALFANKFLTTYTGQQLQTDRLRAQTTSARNILNENDISRVFEVLCDEACRALFAERALVEKVELDTEGAYQLSLVVSRNLPPDFKAYMEARVRPNVLLESVLNSHQIEVIHPEEDLRTSDAQRKAGHKTNCLIPIIAYGVPFGALILYHLTRREYDQEDLDLARSFGELASLAVEKSLDIQKAKTRANRLAIINKITKSIGAELDPNKLFDAVAKEIRELIESDRCVVGKVDPNTMRIHYWHESADRPISIYAEGSSDFLWWYDDVYVKNQIVNITDFAERSDPRAREYANAGFRSGLIIPILKGESCIAHLSVSRKAVNAFSPEDEELLFAIAAHISPAIQNATLYEQSKKQAEQLTLIGEISRAVSAEIEPEAVFRAITKEIRSALPCERCVITGHDNINDSYQYWYAESDHETESTPMAKNKEFTRWIKRNIYELKNAAIIDDFHDPLLGWGEIPDTIWWKSFMIVPIVQDDHTIAHLSVSSSRLGAFTNGQKEFLTSVVGHLGPAIRNAVLHEQTQAYNARLKTLNALSREITQVLDLDEVLGNIASSTLSALEADHTRIYMLDEATGEFVRHAESGISSPRNNIHIKAGDGLAGIVIQNNEPVIMKNANDIAIPLNKEWFEENNFHAFIGHPIRDKDKTIGLISCMSQKTGIFKQEELEILAALASQAAIAIQNARLFQTIEERSAQLAEAQQIARLGNWSRNIQTGEVEWSDENYRIFGLPPQSIPITHSAYLDFIHPDEREEIKKSIQKALDERDSFSLDIRIIRSDGIERNIHTETRIVLNEEGQPTAFIGTNQDITEQKQAEEEIQALNEKLEARVEARTRELRDAQAELLKKERLATLGQLTATVSHEIRNPLGAMRTSTYVLAKKIQTDDQQIIRAIERIDRGINRCDHIIDEFLDFTRIRKLELKNELIDSWLEELIAEQNIPGGVTLRCELESPGVMALIDSERLRRAFINIFENAHQAMIAPDNPTKIIEGATLTVDTKVVADRVEISISDTGPGIPTDVLEKIYEPLFSTKNFGVGLGLPTAKQILDQHGGGLEINTGHGEGTRFTLWLPHAHIEESVHT